MFFVVRDQEQLSGEMMSLQLGHLFQMLHDDDNNNNNNRTTQKTIESTTNTRGWAISVRNVRVCMYVRACVCSLWCEWTPEADRAHTNFRLFSKKE